MTSSTLQVQLTSFIGREHELAEVRRLIATSHLVTLTGAGGCGKTRLALHVAHLVSDHFVDGVWLVDLVMLREPALVPQFVAQALGIRETLNRSLIESLLHFVQTKQMLIILDNCEHLSNACATLAELLLIHAPSLCILATSRELLGVAGEISYYVPPLAVPSESRRVVENSIQADEWMKYDAIRLFVERARAIVPDFILTNENRDLVVEICRRLDGIPLAIELASTRVRVLSLEQIASRLEDRFSLLVSGQRIGHVPHHQTLRATVDWSYALLTPAEQILLRRLAVFVTGYSLDMVEAICADEELDRSQILELLSSLVNKSLVVAETLARSEARYRLLATIRDYALEKLTEAGEAVRLRDRHLDLFVWRTEQTAPKLTGQYQQVWFMWLEGEHDNIRAALGWALENQRIEAGLRLAIALFQFWEVRNYRQEGLVWFERLLAQAKEDVPLAIHASACTYAAFLAEFHGDAPAAITYGRKAVDLGEAAGDEGKAILGFALAGLATGMKAAGDYQALYALEQEFVERFRGMGDEYAYYVGMGVLVQGQTALLLGKYEVARALLHEALTLAREAGDTYRIAIALDYIGDLARCEQKYAEAKPAYEQSITLLRQIGADRDLASLLHNLGHTYLHLGSIGRAESCFNESLTIHLAQQNTAGVAECLIGFAALAVARGLLGPGARLLAVVDASGWERRIRPWPATWMEYEATLALARARFAEGDFQAELAAGRALSLEQGVDYALHLPTPLALPSQELTTREREVARLIAEGYANGEIADELVLSKRTVEKHIANILSKLGLTSRAQLVRWAIDHGLIHTEI